MGHKTAAEACAKRRQDTTMSDREDILRRSGLNYIPSGRQLPRTPPVMNVKVEPGSGDRRVDSDQNSVFDFSCLEIKTDEIDSMLKGMKDYQLTPGDLEFMKKRKEEQVMKKLRGDLEEIQKVLKKEMIALDVACAARERAQEELSKFPSCEDLSDWAKLVLKTTSPPTEFTDVKSLLASVTRENVQSVVDETKLELSRMKKMVANKRKKAAKERGQLERQIANKQLKIQELMRQLSELKSELAQQEEAHRSLLNNQEAAQNNSAVAEEPEKSARGKQRKIKQEVKSEPAVRGRRKPAGAASQEPEKAAEEAASAGLRRSKRIASRRLTPQI